MGTILIANPGADLYGSDRMMLESLSGLIREGYRVVVTVPGHGPLISHIEARGGEVVLCRTPIVRKAALRPVGAVRLIADVAAGVVPGLRTLRKIKPSAVYVSTVTAPLWFVLARSLRIPVVCHVHEAEGSARRGILRLLYSPLLLSSGVLVNSKFALDVLGSVYPRLACRAQVLSNAVPGPDSNFPRPRTDLGGRLRLVYVGRLSARKGPHVAIQAVKLLCDDRVDVSLELVGDIFPGNEEYRAGLSRSVDDWGLSERVHFRGFLPDAWAQLAAADIVLVPSTTDEPFGNTAVEAALSGRPSVVSDLSGLREATRDFASARLVPAEDAAALAAAVHNIIKNWPAAIASAAADAKVAVERHDPERYGRAVARSVTAAAAGEPIGRRFGHSRNGRLKGSRRRVVVSRGRGLSKVSGDLLTQVPPHTPPYGPEAGE